MRARSAFACVAVPVVLLNAALAIAGTTGSIVGRVVAERGEPLSDVRVSATSPSQVATVATDAAGRFSLLSLAPDVYTITVAKTGFETTATRGVVVLADQTQSLRFVLNPAPKTIATVKTRSTLDVVRPGTTSDVYAVGPAMTQAAQGIGGGGNLNNAYSAIAAIPGTFVPPSQQGWNQVVYVRGGNFDQVGYEFDGVPINRSFG